MTVISPVYNNADAGGDAERFREDSRPMTRPAFIPFRNAAHSPTSSLGMARRGEIETDYRFVCCIGEMR